MAVNQNIKAKLAQTQTIAAKLTPNQSFLVTNYQINASSVSLGDLLDVSVSGATDGAVLLYSGSSAKWVATAQMDNSNTIINGGNF